MKSKASSRRKVQTVDRTEQDKKPGRGSSDSGENLETVLRAVVAEEEGPQVIEEWLSIPCPYCGEQFELHVSSAQDGQLLSEDCQVCCRPMAVNVWVEDGAIQAEATRS
jgi:hypothetical protein